MKNILEKSLQTAKSYTEYKALILDLLKQGKSTGPNQNESLFHFSKLNNQRMKRLDKQTRLEEETLTKTQKINRDFTWLVLTEGWCGDAAQTLPVINKIAETNKKIDLKVVLRDENEELMNQFLTNGNKSIPKLIVVDKASNEVVGSWGPRSEKASKMVSDYKEKHGKVDAKLKTDLQNWYNQDKGKNIEFEMVELIDELIV
ncbi:thioredoxin family protein [Lutimonas zeaxanthinifaciens]|uniref:thioredoxin family protein n=1 Tax=Lutimonas zeaxanthinifaciens TaxID=3060215 RepID=UPI00265D3C5B|nr:thioredoxin family protein [Lutimonas sp. YSD2104]WKK66592.1 thioredoxin family protein [Lutimonas sp. YSD2104]